MHPVHLSPARLVPAALFLSAGNALMAQTAEKVGKAAQTSSNLDATSIVLIVVVAVAFVVIALVIKARSDSLSQQDSMAEAQFEVQLLGTLNQPPDDTQPAPALPDEATIPAASLPVAPPFARGLPPLGDTASAAQPPPARTDADAPAARPQSLLARLQNANMVKSIESYIDLPGEPRGGAIVRLRNNKLALLVDSFESERFTLHNLRRVDLVVYAGANGKAVAVSKLEDLIADAVSSRFAG